MTKATDSKSTRRQKTENAILDGFERALTKHGIAKLGVNAVMREAGVAKPMLYDYFGDLSGLAEAWVERRGIWPGQHDGFLPDLAEEAKRIDPHQRIKDLFLQFANALRQNPVALEILAADLSGSDELGNAMHALRQKWSDSLGTELLKSISPEQLDIEKFTTVFYPAIVYLALRSRRNIPVGRFDLSKESGWSGAMSVMAQTIDDVAQLAAMKTMLKEKP